MNMYDIGYLTYMNNQFTMEDYQELHELNGVTFEINDGIVTKIVLN